ncbi:hypothetical protein [Steroidobacter sp.]|uniref:hypothetical protein n=1 Tax=Steroidobacter sp. TaxID=1978227 RepID=UPI001A4E3CB0|nr:hypothetical protein [Steroidobacter sp.]MBL8269234.1 hypothetical protein [Steroidobacter sp.]
MRGSRRLLILLSIFIAGVSASADAPGREEWVNKVTEDYAGVSAGVEINKRCSILSRAESEVLERDLGAFTKALRGKINPEFLSMIRETSGTMVAEDPYDSCGGEARQAVADARELVDWWLVELKATEQ